MFFFFNEPIKIYLKMKINPLFRNAISQFYIGVKRVGAEKTEYFDVQVTKLIDEFSFTVLPEDGIVKASEFAVSLDEDVSSP